MDRRRARALFQGLLLLIATATCCCLPVWALPQPQDLASLSAMEQSLYSVRYDKEPVEQRLTRLESTILGDAQASESVDDRLAALKRVFSASQPPSSASKPSTVASDAPKTGSVPTASSYDDNAFSPSAPPAFSSQKSPGESDYPTVTAMETKVWGRSYAGDDINQRLQRLEKQVFGGPQRGALVDRVDGLRLAVLGDTGMGSAPTVAQNQSFSPPDPTSGWNAPPPSAGYSPWYPSTPAAQPAMAYSPYPPQASNSYPTTDYGSSPVMAAPNADIVSAIGQVEQQVLRKTYPADPVDSRLSRLETKIFHASAPPTLSEQDRLQRIIAVASAGGNSGAPSTAAMTMRGVLPVLLMLLPLLL